MSLFNEGLQYVFGGYIQDESIRFRSTSGGAFSAIVKAFCDKDYVIFGAESDGLRVFHSYITDKKEIDKFRKSKYSQSKMGTCYIQVKEFLAQGKNVLFSGTPCQIAGLKMFLQNVSTERLLTVEVVCEGVPSPLYVRKYEEALKKKYGCTISALDYRYKGKSLFRNSKWDFEIMKTSLTDHKKVISVDRWFNPFWSIWLQHLMSRPSCYECPFACRERTADITLGDLWGVHLYCPELYGKNGGSSLVFGNTKKGKDIVMISQKWMYGHNLDFEAALRYQGPMKKHIDMNANREFFLQDLQSDMSFEEINRKWAKRPTMKLLIQKYVWGNRQKVWLWNLTKGRFHIK